MSSRNLALQIKKGRFICLRYNNKLQQKFHNFKFVDVVITIRIEKKGILDRMINMLIDHVDCYTLKI